MIFIHGLLLLVILPDNTESGEEENKNSHIIITILFQ